VHSLLDETGAAWVPVAALAAVCVGALAALRGPYVRRVDIPVEGLAPDLDGLRIVQISDLHVGPTMRLAYVQRVVDMTKELAPDLIALTGDIVDGPVPRLAPHVAPLEALASGDRAFFVLGNHDTTRGRRRGRRTSRRWDFACSATPRHHRAWRGTPPDRRRHRFRRANVRS